MQSVVRTIASEDGTELSLPLRVDIDLTASLNCCDDFHALFISEHRTTKNLKNSAIFRSFAMRTVINNFIHQRFSCQKSAEICHFSREMKITRWLMRGGSQVAKSHFLREASFTAR